MTQRQVVTADERMDPFTAVFNGHVNNAHRRAYTALRKSDPSALAEVKRRSHRGGGIMAIFQEPCHVGVLKYISLVHRFVNEQPLTG